MTIVRVMSFNVFSPGELEEEGDEYSPEELLNGWEVRADLNVQTIKRYDPDLIGFQEMDKEKLDTYLERLGGYAWNKPALETDQPTLAWKTDRFELADSGTFWLSSTPDEPTADWNVPYPLSVQWVRLRENEDGAQLLHLNTQFEDGSWGELSRQQSSKLTIERTTQMQQDGAPAILTGDFNCNPWSPAYRYFTEAGFVDTYRDAGHGDSEKSSTFHGLRGEGYFGLEWGGLVYWRVDWILTSNGAKPVHTLSCTIARDAQPPVYPSDHYPVVTELLLD